MLRFDSIDKFRRIERSAGALSNEGAALATSGFYSAARCKYAKVLSILESEKEMLLKDHLKFYRHAYSWQYINTMMLNCQERKFDDMIDLHSKVVPFEFEDEYENGEVTIAGAVRTLYYKFALMAIGKLDASTVALAVHKSLTKEGILSIKPIWQQYIFELCRLKKWDEALDLNNRVGPDLDSGTHDMCNSHFIRMAIYIERYRVEAWKRPKSQRNKMSVALYKYISIEMYKAWQNINPRSPHSHYIYLLSLQWAYLNRKGSSVSEAVIEAQGKLEGKSSSKTHFDFCYKCGQDTSTSGKIIFCNSCQENIISHKFVNYLQIYVGSKNLTSHSCNCCLAKLPEESALVCSGCRVACFCSLDHQRSSWKKDARGLGIGHKMLCPLLKAHRKYENAKRMQKDNDKEYLIRFDRECEIFFSKTLGLKDLCFSKEFLEKNDEGYIGQLTKGFESFERKSEENIS